MSELLTRALTRMRVYDPKEFQDWAFAGMVSCNPNLHCPVCRCLRSGSLEDPNPRTDACEEQRCPCHEENLP